jgi:hypothetical protein
VNAHTRFHGEMNAADKSLFMRDVSEHRAVAKRSGDAAPGARTTPGIGTRTIQETTSSSPSKPRVSSRRTERGSPKESLAAARASLAEVSSGSPGDVALVRRARAPYERAAAYPSRSVASPRTVGP